jgi:hypothetical protein
MIPGIYSEPTHTTRYSLGIYTGHLVFTQDLRIILAIYPGITRVARYYLLRIYPVFMQFTHNVRRCTHDKPYLLRIYAPYPVFTQVNSDLLEMIL